MLQTVIDFLTESGHTYVRDGIAPLSSREIPLNMPPNTLCTDSPSAALTVKQSILASRLAYSDLYNSTPVPPVRGEAAPVPKPRSQNFMVFFGTERIDPND